MSLTEPPSAEQRRHAVSAAMGRAPSLVRYAARYTRSLEDAEDAYQRAMEIALRKAPTVDRRRLTAWLYTVVRNEALAIGRERRREPLGSVADVAESADRQAGANHCPQAAAEWRERYRGVQEAVSTLSDAQRSCIMLLSAGLSYRQIHESTGLSMRQIERAIERGRGRLRSWEERQADGDACADLLPSIARAVEGEAGAAEQERLERHMGHCRGCRALYAQQQLTGETLAALVPLALVVGAGGAALPDPGFFVAYWERVGSAFVARVGQIVAPVIEAQVAGLGRVGTGVAAIALAGLAALPMLTDGLPGGTTEPSVDPVATVAVAGPPRPAAPRRTAASSRSRTIRPATTAPSRTATARRASTGTATRTTRTASTRHTGSATTAHRSARAAAATAPAPRGSAQDEFLP